MPTVPSEPPSAPRPQPRESYQQRQVAESFGLDAARYDRTRPSYPAALVDRIVAASPGPAVLDVGCGTGIVARLFQAAGCRVLGVDPDARMAELARQSGTEVEVSTFETWDPAGRAFDAVVAGQAWHWVDPVAGAAKAAQAVRPGGRLAVFWNSFLPPPEVNDGIAAVFGRVLPDVPMFGRGLPGPDMLLRWRAPGRPTGCGRRAGSASRSSGGSTGQRPYTRDEWLDQVPTFGGWSQLPAAGAAGPAGRRRRRRRRGRAAASRWATPRWRPARRGPDARPHPAGG